MPTILILDFQLPELRINIYLFMPPQPVVVVVAAPGNEKCPFKHDPRRK